MEFTALPMVPKSNRIYRPVGDCRQLNSITKVDRYKLANINSLFSKLHGKNIFPKINSSLVCHQVPIHPNYVRKTAIITPFVLFE